MSMSKELRNLLQRKEKAAEKARVALSAAKAENRTDLTSAEQSIYDAAMADIESLNREIQVEQANIEAMMNAPSFPNGPISGGLEFSYAAPRRVDPAKRRSFAGMFNDLPLTNDNFNGGFEEYLSILHTGRHDGRFMAAAGMSEGIGVDGGFLIPSEFAARMLDASLESEIVRPRATVEPMIGRTKVVAGWDTQNHSANIGGFTGGWIEEAASFPVQKGKTRNIILTARKLGIFTSVSNELLADGASFEMQLGDALVKALGWYLDYAFLRGTGVGQPRGVLADPALISVAKETSQAADTIVYENLTKMFARAHPASVANSVWVCNSNAIPQLLNLSVNIRNVAGTENVGGSHIPSLKEDGRGGFVMLTRPVIFTEKLPTLGDPGDIMLCDFSQYVIGLRSEITLDRSMHVGFTTDETGYRGILRADGQGK